jgi:hypothetical protein
LIKARLPSVRCGFCQIVRELELHEKEYSVAAEVKAARRVSAKDKDQRHCTLQPERILTAAAWISMRPPSLSY